MNMHDYNEAERMIHRVASVMGVIGRYIIPERVDDSHHCLKWDESRKMLVTRTFSVLGNEPMYMGFSPTTFNLSFYTLKGEALKVFETEDLTALELMSSCKKWLIKQGENRLPDVTTGIDIEVWDVVIKRPHDEFLFMWLALRSQANNILHRLNDLTGHICQVVLCPEKLESKVHYTLHTDAGHETHVIEAGLAMSASLDALPYYFIRGKSKVAHPDMHLAPSLRDVTWYGGDWCGGNCEVFTNGQFPHLQTVVDFLELGYQFLSHQVLIDR